MAKEFDIAVVGAGPAGSNAALAAAASGLRVVLLDEQAAAGGQVWRRKSDGVLSSPPTPETKSGDALRTALSNSTVTHQAETRVWDIHRTEGRWALQVLRNGTSEQLTARSLILANGAREYVQPVPGWTTPGVIGLAAATSLLKQSLSLPGKRTVVSGTGPLVFYVASEIKRLGGDVAAVVTPNTRADWVQAMPAMIGQPSLLMRGGVWIADLLLARVPILWGHGVSEVVGDEHVTHIQTRHLKRQIDGPTFEADSLCLGHGLLPNIEAAQMLGVQIHYDPSLGGWVPKADPDGTTAIEGLYLCGDGCGIRGVVAAGLQGTMAGVRAARDLGQDIQVPMPKRWQRAARFGQTMTALSTSNADLEALTQDETIICRCESITRAEICEEIKTGAASTNAVKSGQRAGMGPCGGKYCQPAIAALIAQQTDRAVADIKPATPRPPLRPIPLGQAAGSFEYDDLPIPKPAPL